ncbi:MAG: ShlB/FhaC/HecB family hemolysin secretion/activation protein, partial [Pseudomonadota bacterium]
LILALFNINIALSQNLPGPADSIYIDPFKEQKKIPNKPPERFIIPEVNNNIEIPNAAKNINFTLRKLQINGSTIFSEEELKELYSKYIDKKISLEVVWMIAGRITSKYQSAGYFISKAYVPAQEISDGIVIINVVEGKISDVQIDSESSNNYLIQQMIAELKTNIPINAYKLESFMLRMNDLPGLEYRALMEPMNDSGDGATRLNLKPIEESPSSKVSFDNYGSRFIGPFRTTLIYQDSFLPLHDTSFAILASNPTSEVKYGSVQHDISIWPEWEVNLAASHVVSEPGSLLTSSDLDSETSELSFGITWQPIRQRARNMKLQLKFDGKNTNGDVLTSEPLTRDRVRVARLDINYDQADRFRGHNYFNINLNQGLDVFSSSQAGDLNLSREEATPDFSFASFYYIRQQILKNKFALISHITGQIASDPLFSSEEFTYGGQSFGRAYDSSEINGDDGLAASIEFRYLDVKTKNRSLQITPYSFYDIGKVWNQDADDIDQSAASIGFGGIFDYNDLSANLGIAWPLTKSVNTPLYGGNGKNPRYLMQISYEF